MSDNTTGPAYRIETRRLVVRCWEPVDAPLLKAAVDSSIEHLLPWMPWAEDEPQELDAKVALLRAFRGRFDLDQDYVYGILTAAEDAAVGGSGLHTRLGQGALEIGYWIATDYINQGLATETAAALTKVAFEVNQVRRVEIHCDPANTRSAAIPAKLGYTHEATLRQRLPLSTGQARDVMIWTILREEYPGSPAAAAEIKAYDVTGRRIL